MAKITRTRTLSPETRLPTSPYRVNVEKVLPQDQLEVEIYKNKNVLWKCYLFHGEDLMGKKSIHFREQDGKIIWISKVKYLEL